MEDEGPSAGTFVLWVVGLMGYSLCLVELGTRWLEAHQLFHALLGRFI